MKRTYNYSNGRSTITVRHDTNNAGICPECGKKQYLWIVRPDGRTRVQACFACGFNLALQFPHPAPEVPGRKHIAQMLIESCRIEGIFEAFRAVQAYIGVTSNEVEKAFFNKWQADHGVNLLEFWHRGMKVHRHDILVEYVTCEVNSWRVAVDIISKAEGK